MSDVSDILVLILGNGTVDVRANLRFKQLDYVRDDRILSMIYSAADLFVAPTLQDNLPNTILEAISCGVPVVAFNVGGVPEIIRDGVEGRLVPCRDIAALRSAIYTSLENNDVRLQMGVNARQRALQEYGLQLQASRYLELYNSLISRANAS
jgi:glycosyltransferase involved in cell wall biosynthesis